MTDLKKLLLAGTAVVALGASAPAFAAPVEIGNDVAVVNGTGINDADNIIDANNDAGDELDVDLNGTALTLGADGATAGIDGTGAGEADASLLYFENTTTTAATVTVEDNAGGVAILTDGAAADLTITLGTDDTTASLAATNMIVDGDVSATGGGTISFVLDGFDGNTLTLNGDVALAGGSVTMNGVSDTLVFGGSAAQTWTTGDIEGGNLDINQSVDFAPTTAFGNGTAIETVKVAAGAVAEFNGNVTTDVDGVDFLLEGAAAEINLAQAAILTGNITTSVAGTGILDVDANSSVVGSIGTTSTKIGAVEIADGVTLTVDATGGDAVLNATSVVIGDTAGLNAGLTIAPQANDVTVLTNITTANAAQGLVTVQDTGTVTFAADLGTSATNEIGALDVGDGTLSASVVTQGNVYVDAINIADESTLTVTGTGVTVSGIVEGGLEAAGAAGEGNLVVGNGTDLASVTFASAIGTTALDSFTVSDNATANVSNGVTVTAADGVDGVVVTGTLNVDTTGGAVTVDSTDGNTVLNGTLRVTGDSGFTLGGADAITAGADGSAALYAGDAITLADALTVGDGTGDVFTIYAAGRDGNGGTDAGFSPADVASVIVGGGQNVTVTSGSTLQFGLSGGEYDSGDSITFVDGIGAGGNITNIETAVGAGSVTLLDSGLVSLTLDADNSDADTLVATVGFRDATNVFSTKTYAGAANSLLAMSSASTTGELQTIRQNLISSATSASASEEVAESISPTVDGGATNTALTNVSNSANGLTGQRLASLRDGTSETGMAAGNLTHGLKMWAQVFGSTGEQDERDGIAGYDVDTYGVTVGIDTQTLAEDWVWGLAFTYADTEVDSNNVNSTNTEIDTYQIALYADYKWDAQTYVNGIVGYGFNDADQTRHNVGTIAGLSANSDFDTDQFFAKLETGRDYELNNGTTLTPFALANFSYLDTEGYTETGAGTANLTVDTDDQYIFELGLGLEASWLHELEDGSYLKPSLVAGYRYDLADDEVEATSTFNNTGAVAFQTKGFDPQNHTFNVGAGLTFYTTANWELSADYNYELKEDYDSHNGFVRAAYRF